MPDCVLMGSSAPTLHEMFCTVPSAAVSAIVNEASVTGTSTVTVPSAPVVWPGGRSGSSGIVYARDAVDCPLSTSWIVTATVGALDTNVFI